MATRWTKSTLVKAGVQWAQEHHAWPTWTDNPASDATVRRLFKTFDDYEYAVRKSYSDTRGVADWDVVVKTAPKTRALVDHMTTVIRDSLDTIEALPPP